MAYLTPALIGFTRRVHDYSTTEYLSVRSIYSATYRMATTTRSQAGQQDYAHSPASLIAATQAMTLAYTDEDDEVYDEDDDDDEYDEYEEYDEEQDEEEDDNEIIATQLRQHEISQKYRIPPAKLDSSQQDIPTDCAICKSEYNDCTAHMVHLPCHKTHIFHRACIRKWAKHSPTCPYCRAGIPAGHLARTACAICKLEYDDRTEDVVFLLCDPNHAFHHDCLFRGLRVDCRECPCCGREVPVLYRALSLLIREMRRVGVEDPRMVCVPEVEKMIAETDDQERARRELYGYWLGRWC